MIEEIKESNSDCVIKHLNIMTPIVEQSEPVSFSHEQIKPDLQAKDEKSQDVRGRLNGLFYK